MHGTNSTAVKICHTVFLRIYFTPCPFNLSLSTTL
uniref:Uncharacterized protein n=1 Tax=Anguilla anguilla TaxID=7936 RepID=A0A0E9Q5K3_ANGAN